MKLSLVRRSPLLLYILGLVVVAVGIYLLVLLGKELATPNYGFHGTHYDFLAFYSVAQAVLHHHARDIYNASYLTNLQRQVIPHPVGASGYMPFLNPPFVSVLLAPLALLNINSARVVWLVLSVLLAGWMLYQLTGSLTPKKRWLTVGLLLLTFPIYQTFIEGQLSLLVLLGGCLAYIFFKRGNKLLSGASLVFLWVLPQFGVCVLIGLVVQKQWQMLKGWVLASLAAVLVTLPVTGWLIYFRYVHVLAAATGNHFTDMSTSAQLTWRGTINLSMGINGFYSALLGPGRVTLANLLFVVTGVSLVTLFVKAVLTVGPKPSKQQGALLFSAALLLTMLVDPHLFAQDMVVIFLLLPALYVLFKQNKLSATVLLAAMCDLALLDQYSRLHFFVIAAVIATLMALRNTTTTDAS
jgi:hypothetical protein